MSLLLLLNPKQYGGTVVTPDTSDILDVYRKRRKKRESDALEEAIAAQLLQARQKDIVLPAELDPIKLGAILKSKLYDDVRPGEVQGDERKKRIRYLLIALILDH
jgi:hypothetical protein